MKISFVSKIKISIKLLLLVSLTGFLSLVLVDILSSSAGSIFIESLSFALLGYLLALPFYGVVTIAGVVYLFTTIKAWKISKFRVVGFWVGFTSTTIFNVFFAFLGEPQRFLETYLFQFFAHLSLMSLITVYLFSKTFAEEHKKFSK